MKALAREIDGTSIMSRAMIEASIAGSERPSTILYRKAVDFVLQGNALIRLHPSKDINKFHISREDKKEIYKMVTLLKVLKRTDFCEKMADMLKVA